MRENILADDNSSDFISKKFWSHLKSKTKSSRVPETVHIGEIQRSDPLEKAELFNEHFYRQFTRPSKYNIPINFHNEEGFQIDLNSAGVEGLLSEINVNKAMGPDGIHGRILSHAPATPFFPPIRV